MLHGPVRLILLAALLASGCSVMPPAEDAQTPVTADTELAGSPAMSLLERAGQARDQGRMAAAGAGGGAQPQGGG